MNRIIIELPLKGIFSSFFPSFLSFLSYRLTRLGMFFVSLYVLFIHVQYKYSMSSRTEQEPETWHGTAKLLI